LEALRGRSLSTPPGTALLSLRRTGKPFEITLGQKSTWPVPSLTIAPTPASPVCSEKDPSKFSLTKSSGGGSQQRVGTGASLAQGPQVLFVVADCFLLSSSYKAISLLLDRFSCMFRRKPTVRHRHRTCCMHYIVVDVPLSPHKKQNEVSLNLWRAVKE
jgi:hypothetical protein